MSTTVTVHVDLALDSDPFATAPTWTTVPDVELAEIVARRGRRGPLERPQAGRATITLHNVAREFDPGNTSSAQYGDGTRMAPDRRVRIRLTQRFNGAVVDERLLFVGHIASWATEHRSDALLSPVRIEAIDPLGYLGSRQITLTTPGQGARDRVVAVLDAIGWPGTGTTLTSGWRNISTATDPLLTAKTYTNTDVLSILRECAAASIGGNIHAMGNGEIRYVPTRSVAGTPATPNRFGQTGTDRPYVSADYGVDRADVITVARITGATEQVATSTITRLLPREHRDALPLSDANALALAQVLIARFEVPRLATRILTVDRTVLAWPERFTNLHDIDDYIQLRIAPPVGAAETRLYVVDAVEHRLSAADRSWISTHTLTPREVYV